MVPVGDPMTTRDLVRDRLINQQLARPTFTSAGELVSWFGAVQAQEYASALWAVARRLRKATAQTVEDALADRRIIRTWPMRGTLHFVSAADARWMLALLTPRVVGNAADYYRRRGLDEAMFARCRKLLIKALRGGTALTRPAIYGLLEAGGVSTGDGRGLHLLGAAAQAGLICFGPRQGKQQTFVLLEEWLPAAAPLSREEAIAEVTKRYFTSHGPATLRDLMWWSGLTVADAKSGVEAVASALQSEKIDGETYWFRPPPRRPRLTSPCIDLLPVYDEYLVGYRDRTAVLDPASPDWLTGTNGIFSPVIVLDGRVIGTWTRTLVRDTAVVKPRLARTLAKPEREVLQAAAERYAACFGLSARVAWPSTSR